MKLTEEDKKEISGAAPIDEIAGEQTYNNMQKSSWRFANTPPKGSRN